MVRARCLLGLVVAAFPLTTGVVRAADVQTITHGREVDLEDHLVPGSFVLFDFYADWCAPCRALDPHLRELADRHPDRLALRKVDVINWDSAVARQYRLSSIPYLVLYGPDGTRLAAGDAPSVLRRLEGSLGRPGEAGDGEGRDSPLAPLIALAAVIAATVALVRRGRRPAPAAADPRAIATSLPRADTVAEPGDPAIWFTLLQESLEGPFTRSQLRELVRRGAVDPTAAIRRRGDADWRVVSDLLE